MTRYLGVDLGATTTRAAVADSDGTVLGRCDRPTPAGADGTAMADAVREAVRGACREAGVDPASVDGAAVASVGTIDRERGGIVDPANAEDTVAFVPLVDPLADLLGLGDVALCNDATAGAIGERARGGTETDDLVYLTISSGIGAGVVADGRVLSGHRGNAGEVGHVTLDPDGTLPCGCGATGHWEAYAGGENLPRYARYLAEEADLETDLDHSDVTAAEVFAAVGDDTVADRLVERVAGWNARGVGMVVHAYDPEVIVLGGSVALNNPEHVLDPVVDRLPDHVRGEVPEVRLTSLGDDVVLYGAIQCAIDGR